MDTTTAFVALLVALAGAVIGGLVTLSWARGRYAADLAAARAERDVVASQFEALGSAQEVDDRTARELAPLRDTLTRMERQVSVLERDRVEQFGSLGSQLREVGRTTQALQSQTASLSSALQASTVRGAWGEVQLRRVLELSGLLARCDFDEQVSAVSRHDRRVRPDVVITLPGSRHVVVDSKAPLSHFLAAHGETTPEDEKVQLLAAHATAMRRHVDSLAAKEYWTAFVSSPEMVVCFVPGEALLATALADDPALYEYALSRKVVLASPGTLFAVLRTMGAMWQQDAMEQHARELLKIGEQLYQRLSTLGSHTTALGQSLTRSVEQYNKLVGALEARVLVTARRMHELDLASEQPPSLAPIEAAPRSLSAPELLDEVARTESERRDSTFLDEQGSGNGSSIGRTG